jgi:purine-nucleoside phosphorylase
LIYVREPQVKESVEYLRRKSSTHPHTAIILGSGLGDFADNLPGSVAVPTAEIPHYPLPTVQGHRGRLVFAEMAGHPIVALQGRIHFYESHDLDTVLYPIHVVHQLGVRNIIVTNAAGGINRAFSPGDIMVITDQINLTLQNGLIPRSSTDGGLYAPELVDRVIEQARLLGIELRRGVYAGVKGPSYETAAEVEMLYRLGGDAVGMSTVFEVLLANALNLKVLGLSCITNLATGIGSQKLSHAEVTEVGNRVKSTFSRLLAATIPTL